MPKVATKVCTRCKQEKFLREFFASPKRKDGLYPWCRSCNAIASAEYQSRRKLRAPKAVDFTHKLCPDCKKTKVVSDFSTSRYTKDGLNYSCKSCSTIRTRARTERIRECDPILPASGKKKCPKCKTEKPIEAFSKNRARYDHLDSTCKECIKKPHREKYFQRTYGISVAEYNVMLESQNGVCYLCGKPETWQNNGKTFPLCVDHSHDSSQTVRKLLCNPCNLLVGSIERAGPKLLVKAVRYVSEHEAKPPS